MESSLAKAKSKAENPMDMGMVLDPFLTNDLKEGAKSLRSLAACCNGIAAFHLLKHSLRPAKTTLVSNLVTAVGQYREILRIAQDNSQVVKLDDIQRMYVYHDLEDALKTVDALKSYFRGHQDTENKRIALQTLESLGRSVLETTLGREVNKLQRKYVANAAKNVTICTEQFEKIAGKLGEKQLISSLEDEEDGGDKKSSEAWLWSLVDKEEYEAGDEDSGDEENPYDEHTNEGNTNEETLEKGLKKAQREARYGTAQWWEKHLQKSWKQTNVEDSWRI